MQLKQSKLMQELEREAKIVLQEPSMLLMRLNKTAETEKLREAEATRRDETR